MSYQIEKWSRKVTEKKSIDRRITRTKQAIRAALVSIISEKGFEALTISDIVERANINRGTFYLHYKDKFDLLENTETEVLQEIQSIFLKANSFSNIDGNSIEYLQRLVVMVLEYVKDHADLMRVFLGIQGNYSFTTRIRNLAEQNLKLGVLTGLHEENFSVPREYLLTYVLHANLGLLQAWFVSGCKETPQEMAAILLRLSFDGPMRSAGFPLEKLQSDD